MPRRFFILARTVKVKKFKARGNDHASATAGNTSRMVEFQYADDLGDEEYPDEADASDDMEDESTRTIRCPACDSEVYEDAPQCPICGHYITAHDRSRQSWWWAAVVALLIISVLLWLL